jgi:hypothetical protein
LFGGAARAKGEVVPPHRHKSRLTSLRIYLWSGRNILRRPGLAAPKTYDQLIADVDAQGMVTYPMSILRDIDGAGKLGVHVRKKISQELRARGIDHLPEDLPANQGDAVRVFKRGTPLYRVIQAVLDPSPDGDSVLRSIVNDDAREKIEQIERILAS